MLVEDRVLDLLVKWKESADQGAELSADALAEGDEELAAELRRHIGVLEKRHWADAALSEDGAALANSAQTILSVLILPENLAVETLRAHLKKAGLLSADELQRVPAASTAYQLAGWLLESKQLTRFQLRAIASGRTRGLKLGRYVILDQIGKGGMGQVYRARHSRMGREVAIKVLAPEIMSKPNAIERFEREVRLVAKLHHENIVAAYDADEAQDLHFLVMEFVDGPDLESVVRRGGPTPVLKAVNYLLQAARGLQYAHEKGLIHRDVKPANLLLSPKGIVKILDLGIARFQEEADKQGLTKSGAVMGTIDYMAPEQAIDAKSVTPQADIYSLGCTLCYLLTGQPPFGGDTLLVKLLNHRDQAPVRLTAARDDVPPALDAVYQKCLAKQPGDRYRDTAALVSDLEQVFQQLRGLAPPSSLGDDRSELRSDIAPQIAASPRLRNKPRKQGAAVYSIVAGVGLLLVGLAYLAAGSLAPAAPPVGELIVNVDESDFAAHLHDQELKLVNQESGAETTITLQDLEKKLSLTPGRYQALVGGDDGLWVDVDEFAVAGDKPATLNVRWQAKQPEVAVAPPPVIVAPQGPPRDYDAFATGDWEKLANNQAEFDQMTEKGANLLTPSSFAKFENGTITLQGVNVSMASAPAKNFILRAKIKNHRGQHISLRFYRPGGRVVVFCANGSQFYGVGGAPTGGRWRDFTSTTLPSPPPPFFEFAVACIGETVMVYVDGVQILESEQAEVAGETVRVGIGATETSLGEFRDVEFMVLPDDAKLP
ncbi:serine/threonine-protein kinase [Blastopirellula marina]|uniref:non-specific serine/threonine protein kinase n=1 Tax=Blastopirellula marina TaxID=124 RepID=A0A2S8GT14_9BACT|nr:serine/threonine-protein kinase [Blastopirellula marina]PQO47556.1 hypothetical protein C5Y93_02530 [Blastopirellula marina]